MIREIRFLGQVVSSDGVQIVSEHTKAIRNFPRSKSIKAISIFIGVVNFFDKFIFHFTEEAAHFILLRRKETKMHLVRGTI